MTDYPVTITNQVWGAPSGGSRGVSISSDPDFPNNPSTWTWSGEGYFNFNFDPASAETLYAVAGIIGWRLDIHVASVSPGQFQLYWNFAFDNPGISELPVSTSSTGYTAYGPEDGSPGSYYDITAPGAYSITVGSPYFGFYANTPYEVLDRMRNGITDGYGRSPGDPDFAGSYNHGYGRLEGTFGNELTGSVVIDDFQVVFYTADVAPTASGAYVGSAAHFVRGY